MSKIFYCKSCSYINSGMDCPMTYCVDYKKGKKNNNICPAVYDKMKYGTKGVSHGIRSKGHSIFR